MAYFPHPMVRQFEICIEVVGSGILCVAKLIDVKATIPDQVC
jgi:hypothetical protein